jgi:hypothetical protein
LRQHGADAIDMGATTATTAALRPAYFLSEALITFVNEHAAATVGPA